MAKKPEPLTDDQLADLLQHLEQDWFDEGDLLANATATIAVLLKPPELRIRIAAMMGLPLYADDEHVFAVVASMYGKEMLRTRPKSEFGSFDEAVEAAAEDMPANPLDAVVNTMVQRVESGVLAALGPTPWDEKKGEDDDADPQGTPD
jgi:hypothetical protein